MVRAMIVGAALFAGGGLLGVWIAWQMLRLRGVLAVDRAYEDGYREGQREARP